MRTVMRLVADLAVVTAFLLHLAGSLFFSGSRTAEHLPTLVSIALFLFFVIRAWELWMEKHELEKKLRAWESGWRPRKQEPEEFYDSEGDYTDDPYEEDEAPAPPPLPAKAPEPVKAPVAAKPAPALYSQAKPAEPAKPADPVKPAAPPWSLAGVMGKGSSEKKEVAAPLEKSLQKAADEEKKEGDTAIKLASSEDDKSSMDEISSAGSPTTPDITSTPPKAFGDGTEEKKEG